MEALRYNMFLSCHPKFMKHMQKTVIKLEIKLMRNKMKQPDNYREQVRRYPYTDGVYYRHRERLEFCMLL